MAPDNSKFFPTRDEREVFDWVINDFPFPLALTYSRLQDELDKQAPIGAAWVLRDTFESLLKFTTCLAIADFLQADPDPEDASAIVSWLFKYSGLSTGDWVSLLIGESDEKNRGPLRPLEAFVRSGSLDKSRRLFPELFDLFFKLKSKGGTQKSKLNRYLRGDADGFVEWRNRVIAHGTFRPDYTFYAEDINRWLPVLHEFLRALRPVFADWSLVSIASDGTRNTWQGAMDVPDVESHTHEPEGEPMVMHFAHRSSSRSLSFGLLLSLQQCTHCKQPTVFFFDKNKREHKKDGPDVHTTYFLEYFGGHGGDHKNLLETQKLIAKLLPQFNWERTSYDSQEVQANLARLFRDFDKELVRPAYLVDNLWRIVEEHEKGYVHLVGESGMGKTFFVRALEGEGKKRNIPVLAYHILAGALSDYRTFISELSDRAKEKLQFRTQEAQTNVAAIPDLQAQFATYLAQLMSANGLDQLVVAIDALDELPELEASTVAITGLLPAPDQLPAGCFVLLTSREALQPRIREDLEQLEQSAAKTDATGKHEHFTKIRIRPDDAENQQLLRTYLQEHLPERFRDRASMETLLERSGGIFLYASHFCRALESGAFASMETLPEGRSFYATYLANLREATGILYDNVYLKALILLAAAQTPVTVDQLVGWSVPRKDLPIDLPIALLGIKDFLRLHRLRMWHDSLSTDEGDNRYDLAHEAFIRYLREDEAMTKRLREAHADIARLAMAAHQGKWNELDAEDDGQLYDLRFVLVHLREAGLRAEDAALNDEGYAEHCWTVGSVAAEKEKFIVAAELYDNAISAYRYLINQGRGDLVIDLPRLLLNKANSIASLGKLAGIYRRLVKAGRHELANNLATGLMNQGNAFADLGKFADAIRVYDEAINIYQQLVTDGRRELANGLANVLLNKAIALSQLEDWQNSLNSYNDGIAWKSFCVDEGMSHLLPQLLQFMNRRREIYLRFKLWERVAQDIQDVFRRIAVFLQAGDLPEPIALEVSAMRKQIAALEVTDHQQVSSCLQALGIKL
jgi:tetratricopeptide (TPR) repeat protein